MTQLTADQLNPNTHQSTYQNSYFFESNSNQHQHPTGYFVQEPLGKRPFPKEFELEMDYAPRAKRRFDKISACLENFSISKEPEKQISLDSSSEDEEMDDSYILNNNNEEELNEAQTSQPLVCEPDDEPAITKKIRLDESLQKYLVRAKESNYMFLPKKQEIKGNELTVWQPTILVSPRNDFNMAGRITEIDDEEEARINESLKEKILEKEGMLDESASSFTKPSDYYGIVDFDCSDENSSTNSDIGSSWTSPAPSPNSQIVEVSDDNRDDFTPSSLTTDSVTDEEMMDFED